MNKIILASKSKVRKNILDANKINAETIPSNVDEDIVKKTLIADTETPFSRSTLKYYTLPLFEVDNERNHAHKKLFRSTPLFIMNVAEILQCSKF